MGVAVIDCSFPKMDGYGIAATWLRSVLSDQIEPVATAKIICLSAIHPLQFNVVKRIRKEYPRAWMIVGGGGALSPAVFSPYVDAVHVGDSTQIIKHLRDEDIDSINAMPNVLVEGKYEVKPGCVFPWSAPFVRKEDGSIAVWCSRGCRKKCAFCQVSWGVKHVEHPDPAALVRRVLKVAKKNKLSYLSNDVAALSFSARLPQSTSSSDTFDALKKHLPLGRIARIGVEGVSERLRLACGKPIPSEDLLRVTKWLFKNKKSVRWFLIAGLPGESQSDWDEIKSIVLDLSKTTDKGVLELDFNAWVPEPASPLGCVPIDDRYWELYNEFREWFFRRAWSPRLKIHRCLKPDNRAKKSALQMGTSINEVYAPSGYGPNNRLIRYPYVDKRDKALQRYKRRAGMQEETV